MEENAVEMFHHYGVHLFSSFLIPFRENSNVVVFQFSFHILMSLANLQFIRLQGQLPILKTRSFQTSIRSSALREDLGRGRILIPRFIRSPPTLAILPTFFLWKVQIGNFLHFTEDQTQKHFSYLSGTIRQHACTNSQRSKIFLFNNCRSVPCSTLQLILWHAPSGFIYIAKSKAYETRRFNVAFTRVLQ